MIVNSRTLNKIISRSENLQQTLLDLTEDTVDETNLSRGETAHDKEGDGVIGRFQIDDAEAWAIGTRNGVLVGEDDITYHNNSKYYSQISEAAAAVSGSAMMVAGSYADAAELSALASADSARMSENYEIISGSYMNIAGSYMNIAGERAKDSEAFAMGKRGGALVPPSDPTYHNNSKYYYEQSKSIAESLGGVLRPKGTCLFAELPLIADSQSGDVWNIEDEFTTTSDFREGAGCIVAAGSNVYLTVDRKWDVLAGTTSDYIGATASTAAIHGLVPPAQAGDQDKVLKGDGSWQDLNAVPSTLIDNTIAPIENGNTASYNHARGFQFIKDNYLCVALTNISAGDTLVLDTNYTYADDVTEQIYETNVNINRNVKNLIAQIEYESTAGNAYDVGDQFVYGGVLCKAIATINQGDTFTLGTNYQHAYDITTQIKAIVDGSNELLPLEVSRANVSSLPTTITNAAITSDMKVKPGDAYLSNPAAQTGEWTVTTSTGTVTISGSISGITNVTLWLTKPRTS